MGLREYSPYLGRFLNQDPMGYKGGLNLYAYCGNDLVMRVDPGGLSTIFIGYNVVIPGVSGNHPANHAFLVVMPDFARADEITSETEIIVLEAGPDKEHKRYDQMNGGASKIRFGDLGSKRLETLQQVGSKPGESIGATRDRMMRRKPEIVNYQIPGFENDSGANSNPWVHEVMRRDGINDPRLSVALPLWDHRPTSWRAFDYQKLGPSGKYYEG